ncbi:PQQ-dependent sugar dehydrogenase [Segnochrobactraceae bacterium EtOH-i3]
MPPSSPVRRPLAGRLSCWCLALAAALVVLPVRADAEPVSTRLHQAELTRIYAPLDHPWSLAFLPDGAFLITERPGRLLLLSRAGGNPVTVTGTPDVWATGQGGLLDVAVDPDFARTGLIYLSYAEAGPGGAGTAVARGRLVRTETGATLNNVQVIFRQTPKTSGGNHFGSRLVFAPDGSLFITLGERNLKDPAQDLTTTLGKVVRILPDGRVPDDNPFAARPGGARPEIWSSGHRNIQGAAIEPTTGNLWIVEHGARGGDEVNVPLPGRNYGWPVITHGVDYSGARIGIGTAAPGMEQPITYWTPSIAPSGLAFYTGSAFPHWQGDAFVGALAGQALVRLDLNRGVIVGQERLLDHRIGRIRDVRVGPDGALWLLTDADAGALWRLGPATP